MNNFKNEIKSQFTAIPNTVPTDSRLSWKAKGIFLYLASKPDDWDFFIGEIKKNATDGKSSLQTGLKELEELGYLLRTRSTDSKGQFNGWDWTLTIPDKQVFRPSEKPSDGKTVRRKSAPYNNTDITNTDNTKKESTKLQTELLEKQEHSLVKHINESYRRIAKMREPLTSEQAAKLMSDYREKYPKLFPNDVPLKLAIDRCLQELNDHVNATKRFSANRNIRTFLNNHIEWHLLTESEGGKAKKTRERMFTISQANNLFLNNFGSSNSTGTNFDDVFSYHNGEGKNSMYELNPDFKSQIKNWKIY